MTIKITREVEWVLDFLGLRWLNLDEDAIRAIGTEIESFAGSFDTFAKTVGEAMSLVAEQSESAALTEYATVWQEARSSVLAPMIATASTASEVCDAAATAVERYKQGVLVAATASAAALVAGGPVSAAVKLAAREALEQIVQSAVNTLMAEVVGVLKAQVQSAVAEPLTSLGKEALDAVTKPIESIVVEPLPASALSAVSGLTSAAADVSRLVVDVEQIEAAGTAIKSAYDGLFTAYEKLTSVHFGSSYMEPSSIPDPVTAHAIKAEIIDSVVEIVSDKISTTGHQLVDRVVDSIFDIYRKYASADQELCAVIDDLRGRLSFPPMWSPFLLERSQDPDVIEIVIAGDPVRTGEGVSSARASITTITVEEAAPAVITGTADSDARHDLETISIEGSVPPS